MFEWISYWFETHHTARKFAYVMLMTGMSWAVANWAEITQGFPIEYQATFALGLALLTAAHNYLKHNWDVPAISKD